MDPTWNVLGAFPGVRDQKPSNNGLFYGTFPKEMDLNTLNAVRSVIFSLFTISVDVTLIICISIFPNFASPFQIFGKIWNK